MVYALLDQASQIDVVHIKAALALWTYCEASARFIFGDYTGNPIADNILRALRNSGSAGMSRWNISQDLFHRHTEASKIQAALAQLLAAGKVRSNKLRPANGRGRPTEMWFAV
jgi:hypothetical protein